MRRPFPTPFPVLFALLFAPSPTRAGVGEMRALREKGEKLRAELERRHPPAQACLAEVRAGGLGEAELDRCEYETWRPYVSVLSDFNDVVGELVLAKDRMDAYDPDEVREFRKASAFVVQEQGELQGLGVELKKDRAAFREARKALGLRRLRGRAAGVLALIFPLGLWAGWRLRRRLSSSGFLPSPPAGAEPGGAATQGRILRGNYRVEGELGRGGMGLVYRAEDLALKRRVAIKRMSGELAESPSGREQFLREAQMVAALVHPNIVRIYDIFEEDGRVFLVFEHVAGRTLHEELDRGPRPLEWAKGVLAQTASALDYAHGRKVIHRDLKPSNIMIGADGVVKVMDFGIARQMRGASATQTQAWGTPVYMAPEQELGTVSPESDLYALGVCLFEILAGSPPFTGADLLGQKQRMEFSTELIPPGARKAVRRALEADPARRYHSAAELAADL